MAGGGSEPVALRSTASQMQRGSGELQSTPTGFWKLQSDPAGTAQGSIAAGIEARRSLRSASLPAHMGYKHSLRKLVHNLQIKRQSSKKRRWGDFSWSLQILLWDPPVNQKLLLTSGNQLSETLTHIRTLRGDQRQQTAGSWATDGGVCVWQGAEVEPSSVLFSLPGRTTLQEEVRLSSCRERREIRGNHRRLPSKHALHSGDVTDLIEIKGRHVLLISEERCFVASCLSPPLLSDNKHISGKVKGVRKEEGGRREGGRSGKGKCVQVGGGRQRLQIREVTPAVGFDVETVLGSSETRAGGLADKMCKGSDIPSTHS
ncbi:hypothetical protein NQZ68_005635 [Dissostichus eleginoides]|nr:hypothetical protein NQZ68_005635 [Dissostichus eleginoides]